MELNTDQLLEMSQSTPEPPAVPDQVQGDAAPDQGQPAGIEEALKQYGLQSVEEIAALRDRAEKAKQLEFEVLELQSKVQSDPYKTPAARKIDQMLTEGYSVEDVVQYIKLSSVDLSKLDAIEAMRYQLQVQKPGWDKDMVEDWIVEKLGLDGIEDLEKDRSLLTAKQRRKIEEAKGEAFSFLKQHLMPIDNTEAVKSAQERAAVAAETVNTWKEVVPKIKEETFLPAASVLLDGEQMSFSYTPTSEALDMARNEAMQYIQQNPQHFPRTAEGLQAVQGLMQAFLIQSEWSKMLEVAIRDTYAKAKADAAKMYSGNGAPLVRTGGQPKEIKPNNQLSRQEIIMKDGLV